MVLGTNKQQRTCVVCAKQAHKSELLRIVRNSEGLVALDATGRMPGRGAYVCSEECLTVACKKKKLDRALRTTLGSDGYERIAVDAALVECQARTK